MVHDLLQGDSPIPTAADRRWTPRDAGEYAEAEDNAGPRDSTDANTEAAGFFLARPHLPKTVRVLRDVVVPMAYKSKV